MKRNQIAFFKKCYLFALLFLLISNTLPITAFSQNKIKHPDFEEIFIHTDNFTYAPGDSIWFKAYILDDEYHMPVAKSSLLYLSFIDTEGNSLLSEKFPIEDGFSCGDFQLPDTLKKGIYQIVAYTENMKNESPTTWYRSEIIINPSPIDLWKMTYYPNNSKLPESILAGEVNCSASSGFPIANAKIKFTLESEGVKIYNETQKTDSLGNSSINWNIPEQYKNKDLVMHIDADYLDKKKTQKINIPLCKEGINLEFFPESGSLVQRLLNNVAFKTSDNYGNPVNIEGTLIKKNGDHITNVETIYGGMGIFSFIPNPNESYYVKLKKPNIGDSLYALPKSHESGYVLSIKQSEKSIITFDIDMTPDLKGKKVSLSISNGLEHENIFESALKNKKRFSFLTSSLPVGIAKLTLFSEDIPVAERLIFLNKHKKLQLSIETGKEIYEPREKVEMQIKAMDFEGNPVPANLSLAVSEKSKRLTNNADIASCLLLGSKLNGIAGDLSYYLKDSEAADSALNILLMAYGWSKIERIEEYSKIIVSTENTPGIRGAVYKKNNKPAKNAQVQIINTKTWQVISTETNDLGRFLIPIEDYVSIAGNRELSISAALPNKTKKLKIELDADTDKDILLNFKSGEETVLSYNLPEKRKRIKKEIETEYTDFDETTEFIEEVGVTANRYNPANEEAKKKILTEYKKTSEELLTNLIVTTPTITPITTTQDHSILELIRNVTPNFEIIDDKIVYRGRNSIYSTNVTGAVFVVNGVPMGSSITDMAWVNPLDVKEVKVVTSAGAAVIYDSSCNALIKITLLEGNEKANKNINIKSDDNLSVIKGYKISRQFYSPDYSLKNTPPEKAFDSRSTLYWNPNLILDESGEQKISFFNGDKRTFFQCKLVGVDGKGLIGDSKITLRVN